MMTMRQFCRTGYYGVRNMQTMKIPMDSLIHVILLQLQNGGRANLIITGCSMRPMLHEHRDSVTLVPAGDRLRKGDVALFQRDNGRYVLHRVIQVQQDQYQFCGDNQKELEPVEHRQVIAVMDSFTRKGKQHTQKECIYRLYSWLMVNGFFLRKYYIRLRRRVGRLYRARFKRRKSL